MGSGELVWGLALCCTLAMALASSGHDGLELASEGLDLSYDYKDALGKAILFFEGQRSGKLPAGQRVKWRGDSALTDGKPDNVNLVGGYYDAGDNVKFVWPMAFTVTLLSWAAVEYRHEISSAGELNHLRTAIRWGTDFIFMSNLNRSAAQLFEFADKYRGSYKDSCPFYCSYSGYQDELLWSAVWLYKASRDVKYLNYVVSNQGWSQAVSEFSWDNKFAGAQALLATEFYGGNKDLSKYKTDVESFICALMPGSSRLQIKTTAGGLLYTRDSSNLQYVTSSCMVLSVYSKTLTTSRIDDIQCGSVHFSASQIKSFVKSQVDYILGNNPMKMSYMVGYGSKHPMQLHHRGSSIPSIHSHPSKVGCNDGMSSYFDSNTPNPNQHVGAIVGGPDSNDHFNDQRSDYSHSEPTTYMNAAFVGAAAALLDENQRGASATAAD
ncbi:hypothetical protein V6N13_073576 [Hibiscus sabdariffa]